MPDERQESTRDGIAPAPESEIGQAADRKRQREVTQLPESQRPDSAMGGTSDSDSPADDAYVRRPPE